MSRSVRLTAFVPLLLALAGCRAERTCLDWCGTAVALFYTDAGTLLPPLVLSDVDNALSDQLFLKLADIGPELNTVGDTGFTPVLAESWRFEDSVTISFNLNPAARWHDGAPVRAGDVAFTFATYRHPTVGAISAPRLRDIESVTARDSLTAVFRYRRPYLEQFFDAVYHMRIIPQHLLATVPPESLRTTAFARNPIGNGPFRFVRWNAGESGELAADSTFFLGRPGLRRLIWRVASDAATVVTQLVGEEADLLSYVVPTEANIRLITESDHLRLISYRSNAYNYVGFNFKDPNDANRPHPLFSDRDVRRAIVMSVDRNAVIRAVLGEFGESLPGPVTKIQWIWSDDYEQLPFDTVGARRLLRSTGWSDSNGDGVLDRGGQALRFGLSVPSSSQTRVQSSLIMKDQLARVGIDVEIVRLEWPAFSDQVFSNGRFDAQFSSVTQDPSPVSLEDWTSAGIGGLNYGRYTNGDVERLVREAQQTADRAAARAKWRNAINLMNADAPAVWMYLPRTAAAVHARFDDVTLRPDAWWATLWTWRVAPSELIDRDLVGSQ